MRQKFTWTRRIVLGGILAFSARLFVASATAGQINSTPLPMASGPGLGFVNIAAIVTAGPNNDDSPGSLPDNNTVVPLKRFNSNGYIDILFTVTPTAGVTEYQVIEGVDNNTIFSWKAYTLLLGFGTGAGFTQAGGIGDGLDFDTGPPGGNTTPPTSTAMPVITRPNEDTLVFSGGTQGSGAQQYQFRIDVSDLLSRNGTFTLRQQPVLLLGDYNRDGIVDAADYVLWRKNDATQDGYDTWRANFGQSAAGPSLPGDFNGNGAVDAADYVVWRKTGASTDDYNTWRANFGQTFFTAGSGATGSATDSVEPLSPAVPEPTSLVLLMFAAAVWCVLGRRTAQKVPVTRQHVTLVNNGPFRHGHRAMVVPTPAVVIESFTRCAKTQRSASG